MTFKTEEEALKFGRDNFGPEWELCPEETASGVRWLFAAEMYGNGYGARVEMTTYPAFPVLLCVSGQKDMLCHTKQVDCVSIETAKALIKPLAKAMGLETKE
jgi:hypothetical protein